MGLFPNWSKEKLTDEEQALISDETDYIEERENQTKNSKKLLDRAYDEEVIDSDRYVELNLYEDSMEEFDTKDAKENCKEVGQSFRVLDYPFEGSGRTSRD